MRINALNSFNNVKYVNFTNNSASKNSQKSNNQGIEHDKENPISKPLEQLDVVKASLIAGFGFGARALYYLFDDTSLLETTYNAGQKLAEKNYKHVQNSNKRFVLGLASSAAIIVGTVGLLAGLYAAYNAPKSMYQGKINAHKKAEEMDIYLASNRIEKDLYEQVDAKAKEAKTQEELEKAQSQYTKLKMAKNDIPSFINVIK